MRTLVEIVPQHSIHTLLLLPPRPHRWILVLRVVPFSTFVMAAAKANGCLEFAMSLINTLAGGLAPNPVIAGILTRTFLNRPMTILQWLGILLLTVGQGRLLRVAEVIKR